MLGEQEKEELWQSVETLGGKTVMQRVWSVSMETSDQLLVSGRNDLITAARTYKSWTISR